MSLKSTESRSESAQATVWLVALLAVMAMAVFVAATIGTRAIQRSQAQNAADAAALAAVITDDATGYLIASNHGSSSTLIERDHTTVSVYAEVGDMTANSTAQGVIEPKGQMAPALAAVLARAERLAGSPITVTSLGTSAAALGTIDPRLAVAVDDGSIAAMESVAARLGLCQPSPSGHRELFVLC